MQMIRELFALLLHFLSLVATIRMNFLNLKCRNIQFEC